MTISKWEAQKYKVFVSHWNFWNDIPFSSLTKRERERTLNIYESLYDIWKTWKRINSREGGK